MKVSARGPGSKIEGKGHGLAVCLLLLLLLAQAEGNPRISEQISKFFEVSTIFLIWDGPKTIVTGEKHVRLV
jgi:hypothetical protein